MSLDSKQATSQSSSLIETLNDQSKTQTETEWTLRLKALQQIQDFLNKEDTTLPLFLDTYKNIFTMLQVQLKDLRSAVVKESIKILIIGSTKFRLSFDSIACKFLDLLFSLTASTTNAISKSASDGIKSILESIFSSKIILKVIENSKLKSQQIRIASAECLLYILQSFPKSVLDMIEPENYIAVIKGLVTDSGKIKETGKDCFIAFSDKYPGHIDKIIQQIPAGSRKLIEELKLLKKNFIVEENIELPMNIEIPNDEWAFFENLDVFEAVRLAVTQKNFQNSNEIELETLLEKSENQVMAI